MALYLRFESPDNTEAVILDTLPLGGVVYEPPRVTAGEVVNRWDGATIIHSRNVAAEHRDVGRLLTLTSTQSGNLIEGAVDTAKKQALETFFESHFAGFKVYTNMLEPLLDGEVFHLVPGTWPTFVSVVPSREYWAWTLTAVRITV